MNGTAKREEHNLKTAKRLLSDELKNKCDFENHTWALFLVLVNV